MKFRTLPFAFAVALLGTASLSATAIEHTWVSGAGSNSNPCTFAAPCLTFQGALNNTAAGGMVTAMDAGDFGPVSIWQSVTIDGNNLGSITFSGDSTDGITITTAANVTLQNLTINGLSTGHFAIDVENGGVVTVDNCKIMNVASVGIYYYGSGSLTVENSRFESFAGAYVAGIEMENGGTQNAVVKNTVIDASPIANQNLGFVVGPGTGTVNAALQNVTIMDAKYAVMASTGSIQITNSVLTQGTTAVDAFNGAVISVTNSLITANTTGVCSNTNSKIRLDNNDIYDNTTAIANCGSIVKTSGTNKTSGTIAIPAADVSDSVTF